MLETLWTIAQLAPLLCMICSIIAATTPTPKDDVWIGKLYKFIDLLALNIGKAKDR